MVESSLPDWITDAIFYQIFPDRFSNGDTRNDPPGTTTWDDLPTRENFFGGDLQGVLNRLEYLQDLGVSALYLTPIFKARTNHKYDTEDYFQVDPTFGSKALLKNLVDEIHRRKMHIILDGVFNHCGVEFPQFQDLIVRGEASEFKDWFHVRSFPITSEPLSYMTCGGAIYLPKLNLANRQVQEFILKVGRYWIEELGIDGWRLDVPFKIPFEFWNKFRQEVRKVNPQAYLVGEVWRDAAPWIQGDVFDGVMNYRLRDLLLDYCKYHVLDAEDFAFETSMLAKSHGQAEVGMLNLLGSHDTPRILTLLDGNVKSLEIAVTYIMTNPGAPMIYYGDEFGMTGGNDPDCRRAMPWDESRWDQNILGFHRRLIQLRSEHPALKTGKRKTLFTFNGVFIYLYSLGEDEVIVVLNPREGVEDVLVPVEQWQCEWRDWKSGIVYTNIDGKLALGTIPEGAAMIIVKN